MGKHFPKEFQSWYRKNFQNNLQDFFQLLEFPSISADKNYKKEQEACADWLVKYLKKSGIFSKKIKTSSYPLVYGEHLPYKGEKTLLIYGHYDVQPVDPLEEWKSKPFSPKLREGKVYARGAQDNKGQIFYTLLALRYFMEVKKKLPINVKICLEGEEESGSVGLSKSLNSLKKQLKADYLLVVDSGILEKDSPAITVGARGITQMTVELTGSKIDLHSGQHGGIAYNPLRAAVELLAKCWDKDGFIKIPHFYDDVITLSEEEKKEVDFSFDPKGYLDKLGINAVGGEKGYSLAESNWLRPTLEINGIGGGYFGEGLKTVIPAKVVVKVSCRLVPNQKPEKIAKLVKEFLQKHVKSGISLAIKVESGGDPIRVEMKSKLAQACSFAYSEIFQKPCKKIFIGASIPVIAQMAKVLDCDVVLIGLGLIEDQIHAPNENFGLDRLEKGFYIVAKILERLKQKKA
jgi:acetylornithine deacetylase/succinyl-diaminopimelate desuccinylase-like protein